MDHSEIHHELRRLHLQEAPEEKLKELYIVRNSIKLPPDQEIWRIFKINFLTSDVKSNIITMPQISIDGTGKGLPESGENPFLNHEFKDEEGRPIHMAYFANYFGTCWSVKDLHQSWAWKEFADNEVGVLVKTTIHKVMNEICNINNKFYGINYYFGKVEYDSKLSLDTWKENAHYTDLIGVGGQGFESVQALLRLPEAFTRENEGRLVFNYHDDNEFVIKNVTIKLLNNIKLCKHPFVWKGVVDEMFIDPRYASSKREACADELQGLSLDCPINLI